MLAEDLEWADEPPPDDDKTVSQMGWPWWGGGDKDKDKDKDKETKKVRLPVPVAKEEVDCVVRLLSLRFSSEADVNCTHNYGRIASTGSMVIGNSRWGVDYIGLLPMVG